MRYILAGMEISMGLALRKEDFDSLTAPPPAMDWSRAASSVGNLKAFERIVDRFDVATTHWLNDMQSRVAASLTTVAQKAAEVDQAQRKELVLPLIDGAIAATEHTMREHDTPFHQRDDAKETFARLGLISGPAGRFIRREVNRVEDLRVKRYNALVDIYYALMAFRFEVGQDGGKVDADAFAQIANEIADQHPIVNAYLAQ